MYMTLYCTVVFDCIHLADGAKRKARARDSRVPTTTTRPIRDSPTQLAPVNVRSRAKVSEGKYPVTTPQCL